MKTAFYFLAVLLLNGCAKNDPEAGLPPATQEGRNTAGCLVNGERFMATGYGSGLGRVGAIGGGFSFDSLYHIAFSGTVGSQNVDVSLFLRHVRRPPRAGKYLLNQTTPYYPQGTALFVLNHATCVFSNNTGEAYVTDKGHNGSVELTYLDYNRGISAGTFEFTAASTFDPGKTVTVTKGRFDRKQ